MSIQLAGKTVLVTGVSQGIGRSLSCELAAAGADVVGVARRAGLGDELANELKGAAGRFLFVRGDVARRADCEAAVGAGIEHFGRIDVLINNAATMFPVQRIEEIDDDAWATISATTLGEVLNMCRAVLPGMRARGDGSIISLSSGTSVQALVGTAAYSVAKAGVNQLMRILAVENLTAGVRANTVLIGVVAAGMTPEGMVAMGRSVHGPDWVPGAPPEGGGAAAPLLMEPGPVARAIALLCADDAREITGATIAVDRGFTAGFLNSTAMHLAAAQVL